MDVNGPVEILFGLAFFALIIGFVIYDSHPTVGSAIDLAVQNPPFSVPFGLVVVFLLLFAKGGGGEGM